MSETEIYRISTFNKDKYYEFALKTREVGTYPNTKYYTTNTLLYLGKHIKSEEWGFHDGHGGAETFVDETGKNTRIIYDYEGQTCFREVVERVVTITDTVHNK